MKIKNIRNLAILLLAVFLPFTVAAQNAPKKAIYFYSETCPHCVRVNQYFEEEKIYEKYEIRKVLVGDFESIKLFNQFFDAFGIRSENRGYPAIFFGTEMLMGDEPIIDEFVKKIGQVDAADFPDPENIRQAKQSRINAGQIQDGDSVNKLHVAFLVSAAFVDAMNPCALAVLILLLATVMASKGKKSALLAGLLFSLAIFISYFLMGISAYSAISSFGLPKKLSLAVGIFSIVIGLANLKDVFWPGKIFVMEVPMSWRPRMQQILKSVSSPIGAFGAGFVVSLFLVPCASGPYLGILGLMATKGYTVQTLPLLILYNLVFVSPMIIITLAMYFFDTKMGKLEAWRQKNNWLLHSVTGAVMLFLGAYLIYGWVK